MREAKPFYKKSHKAWYVEHHGKQVRLATNEDEAYRAYHKLMAGETQATDKTTVAELVRQFLDWIERNRKPGTYEWYRNHCESFAKYVTARLRVSALKPYHVDRWLQSRDKNKKTGSANSTTYQNGGCRAVAGVFNWAVTQGLLSASPIAKMKRPAAKRRDAYLTLEQWQALIALVKPSDPFYDLLVFLWETGCRPHEARIARADNFNSERRRIVLDLEDSKGGKYQRVIRLNDRAFEIVNRLASAGPIFKTRYGRGWAGRSLQCRFAKLSGKLGFKVIPYTIRHSWITHALLRGVSPLETGILAGHRDATMVMRVYGHVAQDDDHLAKMLRQATGEDAA